MIGNILDTIGAISIFLGALLALTAAVGIVRFPDTLRRMHAATKPQVVGLILVLMGAVFLLPLILYAFAAASHVVARLAGGKGSWFNARMALFWALLAVSPLMLLNGLVAGFMGQGPALTVTGLVVAAGFLYLWINMLIEAEE